MYMRNLRFFFKKHNINKVLNKNLSRGVKEHSHPLGTTMCGVRTHLFLSAHEPDIQDLPIL